MMTIECYKTANYQYEKDGWILQSAEYHIYSGWVVNMINTNVNPMRNSKGVSKVIQIDGLINAMKNAIETQLDIEPKGQLTGDKG
jgi:hypothetical protein